MIFKLEINNKKHFFFFLIYFLDVRALWNKKQSKLLNYNLTHQMFNSEQLFLAESCKNIKEFIKVDPHQQLL